MGAFDEWIEVQNANQHIQNIIDALSRLLTNPNVKVQEVKQVSKVPEIIGYIIGICILIAILN
jgi:hypothetical protein